MWIVIVVAILFIAFVILRKSSFASGKIGELSVFIRLRLHAGKEERVLTNLYIPKQDGDTSEIDLLFITKKGLIVVENKNYSGYIFGTGTDYQWTVTYRQSSRHGGSKVKKIRFYNPIRQNSSHVKYLKSFLNQDVKCFSLVTFGNAGSLMDVNVSGSDAFVCNHSGISGYLRSVRENNPDVLTAEQIATLYELLLPLKNVSDEVKAKHVENIDSKFNQYEICPLCGGKLVLRKSKKAEYAEDLFMGCSNYPRCKYIKHL